MKKNNSNIDYSLFYESIINFEWAQVANKTYAQIVNEGLSIYKTISEFQSATLFLLNHEKFDFYLQHTTSNNSEEITKYFNILKEQGLITQILSSREIIEYEIEIDEKKLHALILPLITSTGVLGLIILILNCKNDDQKLIELCKIQSNYFALLFDNIELKKERDELEENAEDKISLYTKDIVQSTRELKKILDSVPIGIIIVDKKTEQIADLNLTALQMFGGSKDELIGTDCNDHFLISNNENSDSETTNSEERLLRKLDGALFPIVRTISDITLGEEDFRIESFIDITERKKMEKALQNAHSELEKKVEERTWELSFAYQELENEIDERKKAEKDLLKIYWAVHQSPVAIIITDLEGNIEYVNPRFCEMSGYKYEEVIKQNPRILKSGDISKEKYKLLWDNISHGNEWRGEFKNKRKNGDLYWVSCSINAIKNKEGDIVNYIGIQEDISIQKRTFEELIIAKQKAEESERLKTSLLSNMSHEFRTPLIGILGFSQLLISEIADEDLLLMIKNINSSGNRLLSTLNNVLYLSHVENISIELEFKEINLVKEVESTIQLSTSYAEEKGISLELEIMQDNLFVSGDNELLHQAILNIVDNSIKFTRKGKVTVTLNRIKENDQDCALVKIKDTGIGINEEDKGKIFEAFRQVSEGYTRKYEGCGIGLTISQKIIDILRGRILIESEVNKGSTFSIILPLINPK